MSPREFFACFLPMAIAGLLVANVAYAVGVLPFFAFVAGVGAAIAVYAVIERRARVKVSR